MRTPAAGAPSRFPLTLAVRAARTADYCTRNAVVRSDLICPC